MNGLVFPCVSTAINLATDASASQVNNVLPEKLRNAAAQSFVLNSKTHSENQAQKHAFLYRENDPYQQVYPFGRYITAQFFAFLKVSLFFLIVTFVVYFISLHDKNILGYGHIRL